MLIITTNNPGREFEILGMVEGFCVKSSHIGKDILSNIKNVFGQELTEYTEMIEESVRCAKEKMIENASTMDADAIIGMRITTSSVTAGGAEIIIYGTAIRYE